MHCNIIPGTSFPMKIHTIWFTVCMNPWPQCLRPRPLRTWEPFDWIIGVDGTVTYQQATVKGRSGLWMAGKSRLAIFTHEKLKILIQSAEWYGIISPKSAPDHRNPRRYQEGLLIQHHLCTSVPVRRWQGPELQFPMKESSSLMVARSWNQTDFWSKSLLLEEIAKGCRQMLQFSGGLIRHKFMSDIKDKQSNETLIRQCWSQVVY